MQLYWLNWPGHDQMDGDTLFSNNNLKANLKAKLNFLKKLFKKFKRDNIAKYFKDFKKLKEKLIIFFVVFLSNI